MPAQITPLPTPPSRQDPTNFSTRADTFLGALPDFATEANQLATEAEQDAVTATTQAGIATTQAGIATTQAGIATAQAVLASGFVDDAAAAAGATRWVSGTNYTQGAAVYSPIDYKTYRTNSSGISTIDPRLEPARWVALVEKFQIKRVTRSSNTKLTSFDNGDLIDITSGTFTQTFDACSSLGNGWFCYIRNSGTGDITLDPNASETIDGLGSFVMYPGEFRIVQCDGIGLYSVVLNSFYKVFTTSATFIKPPGYTSFQGLLWGGGGSGAASLSSTDPIQGGGGGACVPFYLPSSSFSQNQLITIAASAPGVPPDQAYGRDGGNSSINDILTAFGGGGGGKTVSYGGGGGVFGRGGGAQGVGGDPYIILTTGESIKNNTGFGGGGGADGGAGPGYSVYGGGGGGASSINFAVINGGKSLYGGGGGGSHNRNSSGGVGGTSVFGGSGGAGTFNQTPGGSGNAPGGGGGACYSAASPISGAGARGELRIWGLI